MSGTEEPARQAGVEDLVAEILPAQMPVSYEEEALKAQAAGHEFLWERNSGRGCVSSPGK